MQIGRSPQIISPHVIPQRNYLICSVDFPFKLSQTGNKEIIIGLLTNERTHLYVRCTNNTCLRVSIYIYIILN